MRVELVATSAQLRDRLFQHLLIKLDADFLDVTGLLFAKQIAGAANIHVVASHCETGAELAT